MLNLNFKKPSHADDAELRATIFRSGTKMAQSSVSQFCTRASGAGRTRLSLLRPRFQAAATIRRIVSRSMRSIWAASVTGSPSSAASAANSGRQIGGMAKTGGNACAARSRKRTGRESRSTGYRGHRERGGGMRGGARVQLLGHLFGDADAMDRRGHRDTQFAQPLDGGSTRSTLAAPTGPRSTSMVCQARVRYESQLRSARCRQDPFRGRLV